MRPSVPRAAFSHSASVGKRHFWPVICSNHRAYPNASYLGGLFFLMGILVICCGRSVHPTPKNIFYAITDRRVIILYKHDRDLHVMSYNKWTIHQIQRIEHPDGSGDLIFSGNVPVDGNFSTRAQQDSP